MKTLTAQKPKANTPAGKELKALKLEIAESEKQLAATTKASQATQADLTAKINAAKDKTKSLNDQIKKPKQTIAAAGAATSSSNVFRVMFFSFTFFTIGVVSNFKKLLEEGIGKLMVVYVVALFGFIIWVGLFISWLFFHGVKPPLVG
jgi:hypothetical protein